MNTQKFKHWQHIRFSRNVIAVLMVLAGHLVHGQVNRYLVFFKDKAGSTYSVSEPAQYLSQKAIDRRVKQNIGVEETDLPVNQNYVQGIRDLNVEVFFKTRWMNGVLVQCDASRLPDLESLDFVSSIEFVAPGQKLLESGRKKTLEQSQEENSSTVTSYQLHLNGIDSMHHDGYHGEGVNIAVMDSGFPGVNTSAYFQHLFNDQRIDADLSYDFVFNTNHVFQYDQHGAKVFSVLAGFQPDVFAGSAYGANYMLFVTEDVDNEYKIEEYNWLFAAERADSAGADMITTSLGYNTFDDPSMDYAKSDIDGETAVITKAAQWAADRGILVIASAGNEGGSSWDLITPPADAKDVLAIANAGFSGTRSVTSSVGPSADGRTKPDLAALGTGVSVVSPGGTLTSASGTSFSAPIVAGLAAGLWQSHPDLSSKALIEILKRTASQSNDPDNFLGWGFPNYLAAKNFLNFSPQNHAFEIYPNPFSDRITIRPNSPEEITACRIEVLNTQGQMLEDYRATFNWLNPVSLANFTSLPPGLYVLRISYHQKCFVARIVKR